MKKYWKGVILGIIAITGMLFNNVTLAAVPGYTYLGASTTATDDTYWYIYLKSIGTYTLTFETNQNIDVFLVGGGGGGGGQYAGESGGGGGGGGYQTTGSTSVTASTKYDIVIGAGGSGGTGGWGGGQGGTGGTTTAFGFTANGGGGGGGHDAQGAGGSGKAYGGRGCVNEGTAATAGGQGTQAFGSGTTYYSAGGGGGGSKYGGSTSGGTTGGGAGGSGAATANTGSGGGGANGVGYGETYSAGGAGGSGIVIIRGRNCTSHTGGTHDNGGACTTCGVIYQTHGQSTTVSGYTTTSTQHTPNYACNYSGCTSTYAGTAVAHSGATHNNGGKCTACEYVYETHSQSAAIVDYTTTSTQHTPNYSCTLNGCEGTFLGATELHSGGGDNEGFCIVCGVQYQTHGQSENIIIYKPTETQHTPIYECNLSACTQLYLGTAENHSGATHDNGGACTTCGYLYEPHTQSTTVVSYTPQESGHVPVYSCTQSGCTSTYTGESELHDGMIEVHIADETCETCGWVGEGESDGNTYVLNINYGAEVVTKNVVSGRLVTFGLGERSDATYTVDTGNTVLRVYGNRRQFFMPTGDVVITIQDLN